MNKSKVTILLLVVLLFGLVVGYYFGYDHGWEKAVKYLTVSPK